MKLFPYADLKLGRKSSMVGWLILLVGFLATALGASYVSQKNKREDQLRFEYEKDFIIRRIENRMHTYEGALIQTRAFLLNSATITRKELQQYLKDTELFERFPGIQGLGYSLIILPKELAAHENKISKGIPDYKVWPQYKRDIYTSILVIEPTDWRNLLAVGYDMFTEPVRRKAMEQARDTNSAAMSGKVILVQEEGKEFPGFLVYLPHYKKNVDLSTVEKRRENILGYVYSPFRAPQLFRAMFSGLNMTLDLEIYAGDISSKENLYFNYDGKFIEEDANVMKATEKIILNGKELTLKFSPLKNFPMVSSLLTNFLVLSIGTTLTLLIYLIYLLTAKQMMAVTLMANEKENLLKKEKEHVSARDEFLSIASHELKTPLTSLKLQSQVMMRAIKRNDQDALSLEKVSNLIKQVDHQTSRLTRLVDDMLDISRIRTGRLQILKEEVEISEVVLDVVERLRQQFLDATGEVPEVEVQEKVTANVDRFRIEQVLTNLMTNAIRYGNEKPVQIKVNRDNNHVRIFVIDQGIGVAPENIHKIFERFERAGMSASEVSGLGLGLFITNQIVMAHGGFIEVKSEQGKGSTFIVNLPV